MIKYNFFLLFFFLLGLSFATENIPGTQIEMSAPVDFSMADNFNGYQYKNGEVQIQIHEMSVPVKISIEASTEDSLSQQGITVLSKEENITNLPNSILMLTEQNYNNTKYLKWTLLFGNKNKSVFVVGMFEDKYKAEVSDLIKQSLLTIKWNRNTEVDLFSELPFTFSKNTNLKITKKIYNTYILTKSNRFKLGASEDPYIAFSYCRSENNLNEMDDIRELCTTNLSSGEHIRKIHITHEENISLAGLPGYLIEAEGWNINIEKNSFIIQCIIFSEDKTFLIKAYSTLKEKGKYKKDFMTIINSFKLKDH